MMWSVLFQFLGSKDDLIFNGLVSVIWVVNWLVYVCDITDILCITYVSRLGLWSHQYAYILWNIVCDCDDHTLISTIINASDCYQRMIFCCFCCKLIYIYSQTTIQLIGNSLVLDWLISDDDYMSSSSSSFSFWSCSCSCERYCILSIE